MENNDKKYDDVIKALKGLQQVKAPPNFEADLKRRLNREKFAPEEKSFIEKFLVPSKLIPSLGLAAAAVIMFFVLTPADESENPFMMQPRERTDYIILKNDVVADLWGKNPSENENLSKDKSRFREEMTKPELKKEKSDFKSNKKSTRKMLDEPVVEEERTLAENQGTTVPESTKTEENREVTANPKLTSPTMATGLAISKSGLNFTQVKHTEKELEKIEMLKKKMKIAKKDKNLR